MCNVKCVLYVETVHVVVSRSFELNGESHKFKTRRISDTGNYSYILLPCNVFQTSLFSYHIPAVTVVLKLRQTSFSSPYVFLRTQGSCHIIEIAFRKSLTKIAHMC
jgi:hypothetical protein